MRYAIIGSSLSLLLTGQPALAQIPNACPAIEDAAARLACYDAASHRDIAVSKAIYKPVDVLDFKVSKAELMGSHIELRGFAVFGGPILTLSENLAGGVGVYINPKNLPKEDQKKLLAQCTGFPCRVSFRGVVAKDTFGELAAEAVTFEKR